jgi:ribosomal protein S18 acetylase RimI-like enzyme
MTGSPRLLYAAEPSLGVDEFRRVLVESGMDAVRPVNDETRLADMLKNAGLIVTARLDEPGLPLVGLTRGVTDFNWACYLAEVAVCKSAQRLGVGKGLLAEVRRQLGPRVSVFLASVPESAEFYERIGMTRLQHGFYFRRTE